MTFELFVWYMILAHFIGDYVLQTRFLAVTKGKEWYNMLVHCILYTGSVGTVLIIRTNLLPYYGLALLFISHWLIDTWKCRQLEIDSSCEDTDKRAYLYIDQLSHFMVLAGLITWYK